MKPKLKFFPEPKESAIQRNVFLWAQGIARDYPGLELLNASMNGAYIPGGKRGSAAETLKFKIIAVLKSLGCLRPGYPDLFLPVARGGYHGLYIELKRPGSGKVSEDQEWWIDQLNGQGYYATFAWGEIEAKNVILMYLKGN